MDKVTYNSFIANSGPYQRRILDYTGRLTIERTHLASDLDTVAQIVIDNNSLALHNLSQPSGFDIAMPSACSQIWSPLVSYGQAMNVRPGFGGGRKIYGMDEEISQGNFVPYLSPVDDDDDCGERRSLCNQRRYSSPLNECCKFQRVRKPDSLAF